MPATETTWRDMRLMHQIFAISGVILTVATVWMFYKDHTRPWKAIQPKVVNIDLKMNRWRQEQFDTTEAVLAHDRLSKVVTSAKARVIEPALLGDFKRNVAAGEAKNIERLEKDLKPLAEEATAKRSAASAAIQAADAKPDDSALAKKAREADAEALAAEQKAATQRERLIAELRDVVAQAKIDEDKALGERKFKSADLDAAKAQLDIAKRDQLPPNQVQARQDTIDKLTGQLEELNLQYQQLAARRKKLDSLVKQMTAEADAAQKEYEESLATLERLKTQYEQQEETYFSSNFPFLGKKFLTLPIIDAFSSPRKIETLWSEGLEQNYNFRTVRRFDHCTTCHQSMQKSMPGEPTTPAFVKQERIEMVITVPPPAESPPKPRLDDQGNPQKLTPEDWLNWLGIRLAEEGLLRRDDVTVSLVLPKSPAARAQLAKEKSSRQPGAEIRRTIAQHNDQPGSEETPFPTLPGLMVGDVITAIEGTELLGGDRGPKRVGAMLALLAQKGETIELSILRGLPNPYTSHPRLDLFIGDASPHPMQTFACTICHEGQGSGTDFRWASHTPNTTLQADRWGKEHGWFDNPHWIYPMYPQRFAQSTCLKCHHNVVELESSERYPEAPAPKVVHGYDLIRKYGCYGCHEIKGFDGPIRRVGPDLRLEPSFFAVAQQLSAELVARATELAAQSNATSSGDQPTEEAAGSREAQLAEIEELQTLAARVTSHPEDDAARRELRQRLEESSAGPPEAPKLLRPETYRLATMLKDVEAPGDMRKPGPSLRYVAAKLDRAFLYDWIRDPQSFRSTTRMPRFFGLWDHLRDEHGNLKDPHGPKLEPIEIRGTMEYLLAQSQDRLLDSGAPSVESLSEVYQPLDRPEGIDEWTEEEKVARGKVLFQTRGCLACHSHKDFPEVNEYRDPKEIIQGPDLSGIGDKFGADHNPVGPDWLYSWIREPTRYHARTVMPNLFLEPIQHAGDPMDPADDKWSDPADDIAAYLLSASRSNWKPVPEALAVEKPLNDEGRAALKQLTLEYLNEAFYEEAAKDYYELGIPPELEGELKGAEKDLIIRPGQKLTDEQRLRYIGRKTISKYGCFGCHDIPGFEDAKPIGTGLADWGRKDPSRLAFEHITHYLEHHGHASHGTEQHAAGEHSPGDLYADSTKAATAPTYEDQETDDYYHHQIEAGSRIGFIYQKLREPRSYDFEKTENKRFNERLRMPQFPFGAEEREAVITFVLGLVAEPPRDKYVYNANPRNEAISAGKRVLEKYNCGGCHILELEKWKISYTPQDFGQQFDPANPPAIFPFLFPRHTPAELQAQGTPDYRNQLHSLLTGLPTLSKGDALPVVTDADGLALDDSEPYSQDELRLSMDLYGPTIIDGSTYMSGQAPITTPTTSIDARRPTWGGALTKYLLPVVTQLEKQANPNASGSESLGWVPPPLMGEGTKVQPAWLHDFLLEPYAIRPATFLRMPKFNMTSKEATDLVNYFAAVDNADYPYQFSSRRLESELVAKAVDHARDLEEAGVMPPQGSWDTLPTSDLVQRRFDDAMQIVVDGNYCVKCHRMADFEPQGSNRAKAPNLADVYRRLRPEYLRPWIAKPNMILPYTSMPENIKYDPASPTLGGVSQDLYHGTSIEQIDALVDLLMNYDQYSRASRRVADMVRPATPMPAEGAPAEGAPATPATGEASEAQ